VKNSFELEPDVHSYVVDEYDLAIQAEFSVDAHEGSVERFDLGFGVSSWWPVSYLNRVRK
jgi:hypothetical protein